MSSHFIPPPSPGPYSFSNSSSQSGPSNYPPLHLGANNSFLAPGDWASQSRDDLPCPSGIPTRTHTSGSEVTALSKDRRSWPSMSILTPDTLYAKNIHIEDDFTKTKVPATAREVIDYLDHCFPGFMVFRKEIASVYTEADVVRLAESSCYNHVNDLVDDKLHDGMKHRTYVERHSQFSAKVRKPGTEAASNVFVDGAFIITPHEGIEISNADSRWLRPRDLRQSYRSSKRRKTDKSILLSLEFKKWGTNLASRHGAEWRMTEHPTGLGEIPTGPKTDWTFSQSLVYAKYHKTSQLILDDWTAPVLLTFNWPAFSLGGHSLPESGGILHLTKPGQPRDRSRLTPREAALFLIADALAAADCLRIPSVINSAKLETYRADAHARAQSHSQGHMYGPLPNPFLHPFGTNLSSGPSRSGGGSHTGPRSLRHYLPPSPLAAYGVSARGASALGTSLRPPSLASTLAGFPVQSGHLSNEFQNSPLGPAHSPFGESLSSLNSNVFSHLEEGSSTNRRRMPQIRRSSSTSSIRSMSTVGAAEPPYGDLAQPLATGRERRDSIAARGRAPLPLPPLPFASAYSGTTPALDLPPPSASGLHPRPFQSGRSPIPELPPLLPQSAGSSMNGTQFSHGSSAYLPDPPFRGTLQSSHTRHSATLISPHQPVRRRKPGADYQGIVTSNSYSRPASEGLQDPMLGPLPGSTFSRTPFSSGPGRSRRGSLNNQIAPDPNKPQAFSSPTTNAVPTGDSAILLQQIAHQRRRNQAELEKALAPGRK